MNNSTQVQLNSTSEGCSAMVSIMFTLTLSVISIAALIGNVLVVVTFIKTPILRISTNYYIVNMAVSDLLALLVNWPLYTTEGMLTPKVFISGTSASSVCKLGMYLRAVSQSVSVLSLVLIALDRFVAIVFPLKRIVMKIKIRVIFLSLTWFIPFSYGLPQAIFTDIIKVGEQTFCRFMMSDRPRTIFNGVGFILFYLFPFITIIILYSAILRSLKKRSKPGEMLQGQADAKRHQQNQKIVKILISIVVAFFICWTPLSVYLFFKKLYPSLFIKDGCLLLVGLTFYVFPSLSTAVNPIILFVFSTNYKRALKNLWSSVFSTCKCAFTAKRARQEQVMATQEVNLELTNTKLLD
ncbi:neuropeptides capa receptor-like [Porites lutea]|uniref:neuropeptides capa receptor-like n=1 Tax=Porites lutea TaxID=51062 RepID=UPI003CC55EEB